MRLLIIAAIFTTSIFGLGIASYIQSNDKYIALSGNTPIDLNRDLLSNNSYLPSSPSLRTSLRVDKPEVKGIHVTSWVAGEPELLANVIKLIDETELNSIVIDLKEADGRIVYDVDIPLAVSLGSVERRIRDLDLIIEKSKEHNIYKIARIVLFKDTYLAEMRPDLAFKSRSSDSIWRDYKGYAFTNPHMEEVQDYNINLAMDAARRGFDEIQFDYIRFPSDGPLEDILYPAGHDEEKAVSTITGFVQLAKKRLSPYGVKLSVDVFGQTTQQDNVGVGQNFKQLLETADYISPMLYPSHYKRGSYGYKDPNSAPYGIISAALRDAVRRSVSGEEQSAAVVKDKIRPWFQDFSLGYPAYGPAEVRAQIIAAEDHGIKEWLLWNPGVRYAKEALLPIWGTGVYTLVCNEAE